MNDVAELSKDLGLSVQAALLPARVTCNMAAPGEFLSFRVGGEEYGIDILRVQEIRCYEVPVSLASAAPFIKGVVNLRGVIVPIVDLRIKFECEAQHTSFTVVIVVNVHKRVVGVVVDSVSDVLALGRAQIKEAPAVHAGIDASHITGIACVNSGTARRMLILLDIKSLLSDPAMGLMDDELS